MKIEETSMAECMRCEASTERKPELCPICIAQKVVRGKWKMVLLWLLKEEPKRFSVLQKELPITQTSLTKQLREMEADALIHREMYAEIPPKVEYSLTENGKSFLNVIHEMSAWGEAYSKQFLNDKASS